MQEFLNAIAQIIKENDAVISIITTILALGAGFAVVLRKSILPKFSNLLLLYIVKVINRMFGIPEDDVADFVQELPIVNDMKAWMEQLIIQNELKLIELKNKLASPKLSTAERVAYTAEFNILFEKMQDKLSAEARRVLAVIEHEQNKLMSL